MFRVAAESAKRMVGLGGGSWVLNLIYMIECKRNSFLEDDYSQLGALRVYSYIPSHIQRALVE